MTPTLSRSVFSGRAEWSVHCEHIWTGRRPEVGWLRRMWAGSLEPGGCSFINQVGTVNENTDISLPTLSKITLCWFYVRSSRTCGVRVQHPQIGVLWLYKRVSPHMANTIKGRNEDRKSNVRKCKNPSPRGDRTWHALMRFAMDCTFTQSIHLRFRHLVTDLDSYTICAFMGCYAE